MRAMVYTKPLELQILDVPEPELAAGEVIVQVRRVGICGSEIEGIRSQSPFRVPPLVMGHEFAGERLDTGERVVINPLVADRSCDLCLRGQGNLCRNRKVIGIHRAGAFAERVNVPETCLHTLPANISWEQAAVVEPLANAVHAWRLASGLSPSRIGIIGAGTLGLVSLLVARWRGASEVDVVDLAVDRLQVALELGATRIGPELEGEYDVIFDAVGAIPTRRASVEHLRPGGATVWIGLHADEPSFGALDLTRFEKTVYGTFGYTDLDFRQAIDLAGEIDPSWVKTFPLDEGVGVFTELMNGRTDVVKALLIPPS